MAEAGIPDAKSELVTVKAEPRAEQGHTTYLEMELTK
jgi:hypothetical protein